MSKGQWILLLVCAVLAASIFAYLIFRQEDGDYSKMLVLNLHIGADGVTENFAGLRYGQPPRAGLSTGTFSGKLLSSDGSTVREFTLWDPRMQVGDQMIDDGQGGEVLRGEIAHSSEADLLLYLPYTGVETQFELHDRVTGRLMKSVNLSSAITSFSETYPADPTGPAIAPPRQGIPVITLIAGCVLFALMILVVFMMVRKQ